MRLHGAAMRSSDDETLAVAFFWLVHDTSSGKLRVPAANAGLGIAAAALADLLIGEYITVYQGAVQPLHTITSPRGEARGVVDEVRSFPPASVPAWLWHLGDSLRDEVGAHLQQQGRVRQQRTRLRRPTRWVPIEADPPGSVEVRMRALLLHTRDGTTADAVLCVLAEVTGLLRRVLDDAAETRTARQTVPTLQARLPAMLHALITSLDSVMTTEMLSGR